MRRTPLILTAAVVLIAVLASAGCIATDSPAGSGETITITDAFGREVVIPADPQKVAVVGSNAMRWLVYLGIDSDKFVLVDYYDSNAYYQDDDIRPYYLAHPEIREIDSVGARGGNVDPEKLMNSGAEILIYGTYSGSDIESANEIQEKTGIPVVMFCTGNYATESEEISESLLLLGDIFHVEERANELINYFNELEADLKERAAAYTGEKPTVYVGGVANSGPHGLDSTKLSFYPFVVLSADNVAAADPTITGNGVIVAKEKILEWDPDIIFVDLATLIAAGGGSLYELENDPSYRELTAVKTNQVYTINPDTAMGALHETALVNAYYIGKVLYPEQFADIDPEEKADEIYEFVVGAPVYEKLKANVQGLSYEKITFTV